MRLWIVRHGKAEAKSGSGRDLDRPLAERGRDQSLWLGKKLAKHDDCPRAILSSPILRAIDTAKLINEALELPLTESPLLATSGSVADALAAIEAFDGRGPLMLVGHNPTLETLVGLLTQGFGTHGEMRTGQAVLLKTERPPEPGKARLLETLRLDDE